MIKILFLNDNHNYSILINLTKKLYILVKFLLPNNLKLILHFLFLNVSIQLLRVLVVQLLQGMLPWPILPPLLLFYLVRKTIIIPIFRLQLHHMLREDRSRWSLLHRIGIGVLCPLVAHQVFWKEDDNCSQAKLDWYLIIFQLSFILEIFKYLEIH